MDHSTVLSLKLVRHRGFCQASAALTPGKPVKCFSGALLNLP